MRINGHAHIFTLQSVLSQEAIRIIANRLRNVGFREFIVDGVVDVLQQHLLRPEFLTEEDLLERFVGAMLRSPDLKAVAPELPFTVVISGDASGLGVRALEAILDKLSSWVDSKDGPGKSPFDVFQTLRIAMQPSIPAIAASLLKHLPSEDGLVALMMDIAAPLEPERDRRNFLSQIEGTQRAAIAFPGRVFPFFAVNPKRENHYDLMAAALEQGGFVGVKLYPSLGYEMTTDVMRRVLDFCLRQDVPITVHTTAGGFAKDAASRDFAHPRHWRSLLQERPALRVCFAHCGGWGGFCGQQHDQIEWAQQIFTYMQSFPNVYADLSYHVEMMIKGGAAEQAYLTSLAALLEGSSSQRIIFGTDSWLLRLNIDDALYWRYFETRLSPEQLRLITRVAPARFLGLPLEGSEVKPNMARHVRFLEQHAHRVGAVPAAWMRNASSATWQVLTASFEWSRTNHAHVTTYNHFRGQIPAKIRGRGFDDCGTVRLHQLDYFSFGGSPPPELIVSGNTRNLLSLCMKNGGQPNAEFPLPVICDRVAEILREGRYTLGELGAALDAMYQFQPERL